MMGRLFYQWKQWNVAKGNRDDQAQYTSPASIFQKHLSPRKKRANTADERDYLPINKCRNSILWRQAVACH